MQSLAEYESPSAPDSGINCFIAGNDYDRRQWMEGNGAEIHFEWEGPVLEVSPDEPFPLEPNILYNQAPWRAIIPAGTDKRNIRVFDIKIVEKPRERLESIELNVRVWEIRRRLESGLIFLRIANELAGRLRR